MNREDTPHAPELDTDHSLSTPAHVRVSGSCSYHHLVEGHPAVRGKVLKHRHEELQAAVPVAQQQHHGDQVNDAHDGTGQVIGHVEDLPERDTDGRHSLGSDCCGSEIKHIQASLRSIWGMCGDYERRTNMASVFVWRLVI